MDKTARTFIYNQVKEFKHDIGAAIHVKGIWLAAQNEPPHVLKNLEKYFDELVDEGIFTKDGESYFLTEKGYNEIWQIN